MTVETIGRTGAISIGAWPSGVTEGGTYGASFTLTNQSTYADGTAAPYKFVVAVHITVTGGYVAYSNSFTMDVTAGGTKSQPITFTIPSGASGIGTVTAILFRTDGVTQIGAQFVENFPVAAKVKEITPKGTITW